MSSASSGGTDDDTDVGTRSGTGSNADSRKRSNPFDDPVVATRVSIATGKDDEAAARLQSPDSYDTDRSATSSESSMTSEGTFDGEGVLMYELKVGSSANLMSTQASKLVHRTGGTEESRRTNSS